MNCCFENRITAGDDVSASRMNHDVGLDAYTYKFTSIGEAVVFGTDASGATARQFEHEGLASAASSGFPDGLTTMRLCEDDHRVLAGRVGPWADEQDCGTRKMTHRIRLYGTDRKAYGRLGIAPGAICGDPARRPR